MLYKVKDSDINIKRKHYPIGVNVSLNDNEVKGLEEFLEHISKAKEIKYDSNTSTSTKDSITLAVQKKNKASKKKRKKIKR